MSNRRLNVILNDNPISQFTVISERYIDFWISQINDFIRYCDFITGQWNGNEAIPNAKWIKKVCLTDKTRVVLLVLDFYGAEIASIPVNFSITTAPRLRLVVDNESLI